MPDKAPAAGDAPLSFDRILEDEYRFLHATPADTRDNPDHGAGVREGRIAERRKLAPRWFRFNSVRRN